MTSPASARGRANNFNGTLTGTSNWISVRDGSVSSYEGNSRSSRSPFSQPFKISATSLFFASIAKSRMYP